MEDNFRIKFHLLFFFIFSGAAAGAGDKQTYIVRVDAAAKPSIFPTHFHWYETVLTAASISDDENGSSDIIHTYSATFHGFSSRLSSAATAALSSIPGVLAVIPEQIRHPTTTHSPLFLGLRPQPAAVILSETDFGSDLVIAVLDTGVFPRHRSFSDRDLSPVPSRWRGECVSGDRFPRDSCNRKIVGARYFSAGYEASAGGKMNGSVEVRSPFDTDGHGTHTASIAAGRYVYPAAALGYARGVAAGVAPKARVAVYKVCWLAGCFDSDILAAFDAAVSDGADVISLSVGGVVVPYHLDAIAIGAFAAAEAGVFVSASAGNGGPGGLTVTNVAPWMTTVGAGSIDRDFPADVILSNEKIIAGVSVYGGVPLPAGKYYPLVYAASAAAAGADGYSASLCLEGSLSRAAVSGAIVVCDRGVNSRTAKGKVVGDAGGVGMILANGVFDGEGVVADCHVIPATSVGAGGGELIRRYIADSKPSSPATATIKFRGTRLGVKPAPVVASFSARGPNPQSPDILKPDIIAPGLNILAAWPANVGPAGIPGDLRQTEFNILSGTSMACPHVSGLAALLKAAHPEWSPAAIKSALMTSAYNVDNRGGPIKDESTGNSSDVFTAGAGHVDPQKALDPGLIYDINPSDYVDFLCNLNYTEQSIKTITRRGADCAGARRAGHAGNLNYPSMAASFTLEDNKNRKKKSTHFIRTATNVGTAAAAYTAELKAPEGCRVEVKPERLVFRRVGQRLSFVVRVEVDDVGEAAEGLSAGSSRVSSGEVVWTDGRHRVRCPIVISIQAPLS